jgi:hypothetical protein
VYHSVVVLDCIVGTLGDQVRAERVMITVTEAKVQASVSVVVLVVDAPSGSQSIFCLFKRQSN